MGWTNSTNNFGPSSYVVGSQLGDGVNFTSIQTAINQAVADGYSVSNPVTILIRPGIYTENLTMTDGGITLEGVSETQSGALASLIGSITLTVSATNGFSFSNMFVSSSSGPAISVSGAAFPLRLACNNCTLLCGDPAAAAVDISVPSGTFGTASFLNCQLQSQLYGLNANSRTVCTFVNSNVIGDTHGLFLDSTARAILNSTAVTSSSGNGVFFNNAANQVQFNYSSCTSALAAVECTVGGFVQAINATITSSDPSGFWIVGTANLSYLDVGNFGSAIGLDPGLGTITIGDWKPYATAAAAPGTAAIKGTIGLDDAYFTITDGWATYGGSIAHPPIYQLDADSGSAAPLPVNIGILGKSGCTTEASGSTLDIYAIKWQDVGSSGGAVADNGFFITATQNRTLPAAPIQGTVCAFCVKAAATVLTIQAPGTALIRIGANVSSAGGTCTSTARGDAIRLVYSTSDDTWYSEQGPQGNWTLA